MKRLKLMLFLLLSTGSVIHAATTQEIIQLVNDAGEVIRQEGNAAFGTLKTEGSRWRSGEVYVFVLDSAGNMLLHADPELEGKNQWSLTDINGRPIIRGLLEVGYGSAAGGWYHYQWPVPGGLLPRWKSSFAAVFYGPDGRSYLVGCGVYDDRMEKPFVKDMVDNAVRLIEKKGAAGFAELHDLTGPYIAKDAYIFVLDTAGYELVNPGFPSLEGRNVMDVKDTKGKLLVKEMFRTVEEHGSGWVEYLWPKPGQSVSTLKTAYVRKAKMESGWVIVGCGVYLSDATVVKTVKHQPSAQELTELVREGARVFEQEGAGAYPQFRRPGSKWFHDDTYFFVWSLEGKRVFHAANPSGEGSYVGDSKDVLGRPWGSQFLEVAKSPSGEGWIHYLYPEPGNIFPCWKSSFVKLVRFPDGTSYLVGCGIYNMNLDQTFIRDVVDRAVTQIEQEGRSAFPALHDKTGPYLFMETYVFVDLTDGTELVNPAQPSLEGKNLIGLKDIKGKMVTKYYIDAAMKEGSAWVDYQWYRPGSNEPAAKHTYVRKAVFGNETFVVGAGYYDPE